MTKQLILYVEDDSLSCEIMAMIFEDSLDHELVIFQDSDNFMQRVNDLDKRPVLILLDIHVQPYNGFEMLDMLRSSDRYRDIPVLALTASVMNEEVSALRQSGFNGAISKPIDQDGFAYNLKQALAGKEVWTITTHTE